MYERDGSGLKEGVMLALKASVVSERSVPVPNWWNTVDWKAEDAESLRANEGESARAEFCP
jgi:hypothetical protein